MKSKLLIIIFISIAAVGLLLFTGKTRDQDTQSAVVVGLPAPALELSDAVTGRPLSENDTKGKVVFINFWASWCKPCKDEMPAIQAMYQNFSQEKNLLVLTVLYKDDAKNALAFMEKNNFTLPVMIDRDGKTARSLGVTGVPETFLISKDGMIKGKIIGPYKWDSPEILASISKSL